MRCTKRKPEDEGECEDRKRQDRVIVSFLSGEESIRRPPRGAENEREILHRNR